METAELLKKIRKIELKTRGLSNHIFSGEYHSTFKGRGMSFSEVREYQYGDDVRAIDWNVTARLNAPYIKVFEEERELTMILLIDISRSSLEFGSAQLKNDLVTEFAATLAFSAINNNDKVGVILFSNGIEEFIPPAKGKQHVLRIIRQILTVQPERKGTGIKEAVSYFNTVIKKRSIAFLISDFIDPYFNYADPVSIARNRHDLIGVHIKDKREQELPNMGLLRMRDPETGREVWTDTSSRAVRNKFRQQYEANNTYMNDAFRKNGVPFIELDTAGDYVKELIKFFKQR